MKLLIVFIAVLAWDPVSAQCSCDSLVAAIKASDVRAVAACLESGTDPNCTVKVYKDESYRDHKKVLEWNVRPMIFAIRKQNPEMVKLLHQAGASLNMGSQCLRDTVLNEYNESVETPLNCSQHFGDTSITFYLKQNGAYTYNEMLARGERIYRILLFNYYEKSKYSEEIGCRDSVQVIYDLISTYGDAIEFYPKRNAVEAAMRANDIKIIEYLVEVKKISLKEEKGGVVSSGVVFRRNHLEPDYTPLGSLLAGGYPTIESLEFLIHCGELNDEIIREQFVEFHYGNKMLRKYFTNYLALKEQTVSNNKAKRLRKRMDRIREKLHNKNSIEMRLKSKEFDCNPG